MRDENILQHNRLRVSGTQSTLSILWKSPTSPLAHSPQHPVLLYAIGRIGGRLLAHFHKPKDTHSHAHTNTMRCECSSGIVVRDRNIVAVAFRNARADVADMPASWVVVVGHPIDSRCSGPKHQCYRCGTHTHTLTRSITWQRSNYFRAAARNVFGKHTHTHLSMAVSNRPYSSRRWRRNTTAGGGSGFRNS